MVEVLQAHDQLTPRALQFTETSGDDWLAHDHDVDAPVYLFAYPSHTSTDPHRSRWSIAWPVGGRTPAQMVAWRHVHPDAYENEAGLETDPPRFVYGGAITKTAGPGTVLAKRFVLETMGLLMRQRIEALAAETPLDVMSTADAAIHDVDGHCQYWIREVLDRMVASGVISDATRYRAVQEASSAFIAPHSPLVLGLCE